MSPARSVPGYSNPKTALADTPQDAATSTLSTPFLRMSYPLVGPERIVWRCHPVVGCAVGAASNLADRKSAMYPLPSPFQRQKPVLTPEKYRMAYSRSELGEKTTKAVPFDMPLNEPVPSPVMARISPAPSYRTTGR